MCRYRSSNKLTMMQGCGFFISYSDCLSQYLNMLIVAYLVDMKEPLEIFQEDYFIHCTY